MAKQSREILVVEDNPQVAEIICYSAEVAGVVGSNIHRVTTVEAAIDILGAPDGPKFDLALINLQLGEKGDGTEILNWCKDHPGVGPKRKLVVTAEDDENVAEYCRKTGAEKVISKPFEVQNLIDVIKRER